MARRNYLDDAAQACDVGQDAWPNLRQAFEESETKLATIHDALTKHDEIAATLGEDTSVVFFGSLARHEFSKASDADWTLLLDGQARIEHPKRVQKISRILTHDLDLKAPGTSKTFGTMTNSHELVHQIGGQEDSNLNITRRCLLLLESRPVGAGMLEDSDLVYERVIQLIINRYMESGLSRDEQRVPRFLLNDIVRYWRTICVDFANKERDDKSKWGLRILKLRMSRKLIFASGLLLCFWPELQDDRDTKSILIEWVKKTPIEVLCDSLVRLNIKEELTELLAVYDTFLQFMSDPEKRKKLEQVSPENRTASPLWKEIKGIADPFQACLTNVFFGDTKLGDLTRKYGVF